ncbi:MAG: SHOCT domain-containing protein [Demequina sp.]|nr:SHOCT domain-containing protein [Demequina sp.]
MPIGRIGRPGLVGTMARTAVVAGTATAVSGNMQHRQQQKWAGQQAAADQAAYEAQQVDYNAQQLAAMQQQMAQMQAAQQQPQVAAAPAGDDLMAKLSQLADLKNAGVLSEEEFAAAKAKLLS